MPTRAEILAGFLALPQLSLCGLSLHRHGFLHTRDNYLKAAHDANPDAGLAIGVTQAELQLAHRQTEQALATLTHLHTVSPKHDYVTMLLARAYHELHDWHALVELLPDVRRKKLLNSSRLREMELDGYAGVLRAHA